MSHTQKMHNKPLKLLSMLMIITMAILPLRSLYADVIVDTNHASQAQVTFMDMHDFMAVNPDESCSQCDREQCCQASSCNAVHCLSPLAIVSLNFQRTFSQLNHSYPSIYTASSISFLNSPILQPPRA